MFLILFPSVHPSVCPLSDREDRQTDRWTEGRTGQVRTGEDRKDSDTGQTGQTNRQMDRPYIHTCRHIHTYMQTNHIDRQPPRQPISSSLSSSSPGDILLLLLSLAPPRSFSSSPLGCGHSILFAFLVINKVPFWPFELIS